MRTYVGCNEGSDRNLVSYKYYDPDCGVDVDIVCGTDGAGIGRKKATVPTSGFLTSPGTYPTDPVDITGRAFIPLKITADYQGESGTEFLVLYFDEDGDLMFVSEKYIVEAGDYSFSVGEDTVYIAKPPLILDNRKIGATGIKFYLIVVGTPIKIDVYRV